jgi:hypothetical protein
MTITTPLSKLFNCSVTTSTTSIKHLDYNATTNTPLLELSNCNVTSNMPSFGLADYNITFANGLEK